MKPVHFQLIRPGKAVDPDESAILEPPSRRSDTFRDYLFSEEVSEAVNVAIHLSRPLLVTGEPGTGKTSLAWGIARQLAAGEVLEFHATSTSVAQDLFYRIDTLRRFHDANLARHEPKAVEEYLEWQALGLAFRSDFTRVVLIDEIDKAPRDFPNDLLNSLDRMSFRVPELGADALFEASRRHVVVITSNSERRLPPAFLRRCIYLHIPFPGPRELRQIVELHTADVDFAPGFLDFVVRRFLELRAVPDLLKYPATDELIAWAKVLVGMGVTSPELEAASSLGALPALQALVKHREDLERIASQATGGEEPGG